MTEDDIAQVVEDFGAAAARAVRAGFDAVELHLGHGYLLSQFISPATNRRHDRWGGSLDNRMRLPLAVLARVREARRPATSRSSPRPTCATASRAGSRSTEAVGVAQRLEAAASTPSC